MDFPSIAEPAERPYISTGHLPKPETVQKLVSDARRRFKLNGDGHNSQVYPALARVPGELFGICVAGTSGRLYDAGDTEYKFSIMSVSKPFVFVLVCETLGPEEARARLGANATGLPFNSLAAIEQGGGRTNPMVNGVPPTTVATGIVAYSMLVAGFVMLGAKLAQRFGALQVFRFAVVLFCASQILMTFSLTATLMITAQALCGAAGAVIVPSLVALIAENYTGVVRNAEDRAPDHGRPCVAGDHPGRPASELPAGRDSERCADR